MSEAERIEVRNKARKNMLERAQRNVRDLLGMYIEYHRGEPGVTEQLRDLVWLARAHSRFSSLVSGIAGDYEANQELDGVCPECGFDLEVHSDTFVDDWGGTEVTHKELWHFCEDCGWEGQNWIEK